MAETWTISISGRSYGPYTAAQMHAYAREGRLAPHSLIAREGEEQYHPAAEDRDLADLFLPTLPAEEIAPAPAAAPASARPQPAPHADAVPQFGRQHDQAEGEHHHFIIAADMKSGSITGLEEEIFNHGQGHRLLPQTWLLNSTMSLNQLRNALTQKLGKLDTLFIADASRDKFAWFNFGPEMDSRLRRLVQRDDTTRRIA